MKCPVCQTRTLLRNDYIEPNLRAAVCEKCGGKWISVSDYQSWRALFDENPPVKPVPDQNIESIKSEKALLCPETRHILLKYRIGHDVGFLIDRCHECGGVWLDGNEWETLKERNLHDDLHEIFLDNWQNEVRRSETRQNLEQIYNERFGAAEFEKVREIKVWLDGQEKRTEILAFLSDANPFGS